MNRVVVTGMGVLTPNASGLESFRHALENGVSGIKFHQHLEDLGLGCQVGGIPDFDDTLMNRHLSPNTVKYLNSITVKYACSAALHAWLDAGLDIDQEKVDWEAGCVMGCSVSDVNQIREVTKMVDNREYKKLGMRNIEQLMTSGISAYISGLLGLGNHIMTNSAACATGTESILLAYEKIKSGSAERMIAGSCEAPNSYIWANFDNMRLLPRKFNQDPTLACRPLSGTAGGFVPGSGAGALVLENLESAVARGARIYAELLGGDVNSGAQRSGGSMTAPNREGVVRCISRAIEKTNTDPDTIDLISGHLTATMADSLEVNNWATALNRKNESFPFINSVKSMIGHCLSAAGSIECIASVLQIYHKFIHPTLNSEDLHPAIAETVGSHSVSAISRKMDIRKVIKANFGFGDVNACLVLSAYPH
jgi:3-oxoacyl-(acyl-carrier-protein) synthase